MVNRWRDVLGRWLSRSATRNLVRDSSGTVVQADSVGTVHIHAAPAVAAQASVFGVVPPRAAGFRARDVELELGCANVLTGPAGAGKTQIAADFARSLWDAGGLDVLVWVTVEHEQGLEVDPAGGPVRTRDPVTTAAGLVRTFDHIATRLLGHGGVTGLLAWFAVTDRRWLVVLDDVRSLAEISRVLPVSTSRGTTVVTTRRRDHAFRGHGRVHVVGTFDRATSVAYLHAELRHQAEGADELAAGLGDLPLALAQAAAYIADNPFLTCAGYRERLDSRRLSDVLPDQLPDGHSGTVTATLDLSIPHANTVAPVGLAEPVLTFASMLSVDGVPLVLFTAPATLSYLEGFIEGAVDADLVLDALATLQRLSLVTLDVRNPHRAVRVHAVLRRVVQERVPADRKADVVYTAVVALLEAQLGEPPRALAEVLRESEETLRVLSQTGYFGGQADPLVLLTRSNLLASPVSGAGVQIEQELVAAFGGPPHRLLETVAERERRFGADHVDTLAARHNLARALGDAGDFAAAVAELTALVRAHTRVMGANHPHTLTTRHNLAFWRARGGESVEAELAALVDDRARVLGARHPHTLASRHNLAHLRQR